MELEAFVEFFVPLPKGATLNKPFSCLSLKQNNTKKINNKHKNMENDINLKCLI